MIKRSESQEILSFLSATLYVLKTIAIKYAFFKWLERGLLLKKGGNCSLPLQ
jgi:hypothetical protein